MNAPARTATLQTIKAPPPPEASLPSVSVGFGNLQSFELTQRVAKMFAASTLVPPQYRRHVKVWNKANRQEEWEENFAAQSNCAIALSIAERMRADPLMVMQNLHIIEGRPSWSAVWIIAAINQCGRFEPLRYDLSPEGEPREIEYEYHEWQGRGDNRQKVTKTGKAKFRDRSCIAWTVPKGTVFPPGVNTREKAIAAGLSVYESTKISMALAVAEGWFQRNGSKWQTMSDQMLVYRAASFFGRVHAPELLLGLPSDDEVREILEAQRSAAGTWQVHEDDDTRPPPLTLDQLSGGQDAGDPGPADDQTAAGGQQIDTATGEITQADASTDAPGAAAGAQPTTTPTSAEARQAFEDAVKKVQAGQYDDARAICPNDQMKELEAMIANREANPQAAQAATTRASRRANRGVGGVE